MKTLTIIIILTLGQYSGSYSWQMGMFRAAANQIEAETGTRFKVFKVVKARDTEAKRIFINPLYSKYYQWKAWRERHLRKTKSQINLTLVPPTFWEEHYYLYGLSTVCKHGLGDTDTTLSAIEPFNEFGAARSAQARSVITHELGHAIGAYHDESGPNLMSTYVLSQLSRPDYNPHFSRKAISEIRECTRQTKRLGK